MSEAAAPAIQEITPFAHHQPSPVAVIPSSADSLLAIAVQRGASLEELERLMALKERHEANEARKAYVDDMAKAKASAPTITKNKDVSFTTQKGTTSYSHATLGNVVAMIVPWLGAHGFSHAWDTKQVDSGRVEVTCTLTHRLGHKESVTQNAGKDDSGTKNNIQAMGSAITYLQRYTLLAITGLATEDQDDDGGGADPDAPKPETIEQMRERVISAVKVAQSLEDLDKAQKEGRSDLNKWRDTEFYTQFVAEVQNRGKALRAEAQATEGAAHA